MAKRIRLKTKEERIGVLELIGNHLEKYRNLMIALCIFLLLSALSLCIYWNYDNYSVGVLEDNLYLVCHLIYLGLAFISIVMLVLNRFKIVSKIALAIFIHVVVFVFLSVATLSSILDLSIGLSPISFFLACVICAGIFLIEPIFFAVISFGYYATIMIFQVVNQYSYFSNANKIENILYFFIYVLMVGLVAFRHYRVTKSEHDAKAKLEKLTYYDELTGLLNERSYLEEIDRISAQLSSGKNAEPFAIVMMDVNNLKATNDKYGHRYGCHLVVSCGHILPTIFKTSKLFHVGGDEFIAIVRGTDYQNFEEVMKDFDNKCTYTMIEYEGVELIFSVARGYSHLQENERYQDVLQRADKEMYQNKAYLKEKYNMKGR